MAPTPFRDDDGHKRPAARARDKPAQPRRTPETREPSTRARRQGVVLIVDDYPDAREMYATYFTYAGFTAHTAHNGVAAVDIALRVRPDVIVMDLTMPIVDGIAATQAIKQHATTRNAVVILLTGYPYKAIERGALESGVDLFLTKPCTPEDLEGHVRRLLDGKRT